MKQLFLLRRVIASLGEADVMGWWQSFALGPTGAYVVPRLFARTPALSAAQLAILAARRRQDALVPAERLVHLFSFGEELESAFERWLIQRKEDGWTPPPLGAQNRPTMLKEAIEMLGIEPVQAVEISQARAFALGTLAAGDLENEQTVMNVSRKLAQAYTASGRNDLRVPYFLLRR